MRINAERSLGIFYEEEVDKYKKLDFEGDVKEFDYLLREYPELYSLDSNGNSSALISAQVKSLSHAFCQKDERLDDLFWLAIDKDILQRRLQVSFLFFIQR